MWFGRYYDSVLSIARWLRRMRGVLVLKAEIDSYSDSKPAKRKMGSPTISVEYKSRIGDIIGRKK